MIAILYVLGCTIVFGAFIWATKAHFVQGTKTTATDLIYLFSVATFIFGSVGALIKPLSVWQMTLGVLISALGAALFFWTVQTTRNRGLYLAYAKESPMILVSQGP